MHIRISQAYHSGLWVAHENKQHPSSRRWAGSLGFLAPLLPPLRFPQYQIYIHSNIFGCFHQQFNSTGFGCLKFKTFAGNLHFWVALTILKIRSLQKVGTITNAMSAEESPGVKLDQGISKKTQLLQLLLIPNASHVGKLSWGALHTYKDRISIKKGI